MNHEIFLEHLKDSYEPAELVEALDDRGLITMDQLLLVLDDYLHDYRELMEDEGELP